MKLFFTLSLLFLVGMVHGQVCADRSPTGDCDGDGISNADEGIVCNFPVLKIDRISTTGWSSTSCDSDRRITYKVSNGNLDGASHCDGGWSASIRATWSGLKPNIPTKYYVSLSMGHYNNPKVMSGSINAPNFNLSWWAGGGNHNVPNGGFIEFVPTSTTMTITISMSIGGGGGTGADLYFAVGHVSQTDTTFPCSGTDTDNDGVFDYLDLDSDNDGIPDNIEGVADIDGDGTPNYRDLDSDDDGCSDADEAGVVPFNALDVDGSLKRAFFPVGTAFGANGLADAVETVADSGLVSYTHTYNLALDDTQTDCPDPEPDLGIILQISDGIVNGTEEQTVLVRLRELLGNDTFNTDAVEVRIDKSNDFSFQYNPGLSSLTINGVAQALNNADWTYDGSNPLFHLFRNTGVIGGHTTSAFAFVGVFESGASSGKISLTARINFGSGGETVFTNNIDTETIVFFAN